RQAPQVGSPLPQGGACAMMRVPHPAENAPRGIKTRMVGLYLNLLRNPSGNSGYVNVRNRYGPGRSPGWTQSSRTSRQGSVVGHMKMQRTNGIFPFASAALLLGFLNAPLAFGQVFGRISGTAKDPTGSLVPGVSVTATCTETGIKSTSQTDVQ